MLRTITLNEFKYFIIPIKHKAEDAFCAEFGSDDPFRNAAFAGA